MVLKHLQFPVVLVFGALVYSAPIPAQTLEHRPVPNPPATADSAPSSTIPQLKPELAAGTSLQVETLHHYPMKAGEAIEGRLVYPLYAGGKLVVPANTTVRGSVLRLVPDSKERWHARLLGDFTPFHIAEVQFNEMTLRDGPHSIATAGTTTGAPVLRLAAAGARPKQSLVAREWSMAKTRIHDQIAFFTDPGFGDRAKMILYHQLPYHPERIAAHTSWTFELAQNVSLPESSSETFVPATCTSCPHTVPGSPEAWSVNAVLTAGVTSATAKPGDPVDALVVEPVFDKDQQLVVPQGSRLLGKVTTAKAARGLGRNGRLRFTFQQVRFPEGTGIPAGDRPVEGALAGATTQGSQGLKLDAEGTITPKSQASAIAPLLLTLLAGRALDQDGNLTVQTGVASNGFGLVGRVVGLAAGNRNLAAGLGFYAAGLSFYQNFLRPGHDVVFPKDTRIEIETTPLRAPILKPDVQ